MPDDQRTKYEAQVEQYRIGQRIGEMRRAAKRTTSQLAEQLGVAESTIANIEAGGDVDFTLLQRTVASLGGQIVIHTPDFDAPLVQTTPAP